MHTSSQTSRYQTVVAVSVALGGFLFGFDAAVISGVTGFIVPAFSLSDLELGWAVSSLTLASTIAMMVAGPLSDRFGRKNLLKITGLMYAISALFSAIAPTYLILVLARMLGGLAVGSALILAPMYLAETSPADRRGRMVSIQQLNIVLGFSAAYFSNYYLLQLAESSSSFAIEWNLADNIWRWMLGVELLPALIFFLAMFLVPASPRWLSLKGRKQEARKILDNMYGPEAAEKEWEEIQHGHSQTQKKGSLKELFQPALKLVLFIGVIIGILQQITGVNAIYFYATTIFEQSGVGKDAAFAQAVWVGIINVVFTIVAMLLIDRLGRKPILLAGIAGIAASMLLTAYGFSQATYQLDGGAISQMKELSEIPALQNMVGQVYESDVQFKQDLKAGMGEELYGTYQGDMIKASIQMNPWLVLFGILGFVASFAVSLGPVMWVLLSELFPTWIRGIAISFVGFINSAVSFLVQLVFPWELTNLGNAASYLIFGLFAVVGFFLMLKYLPETKGKSLEDIEKELVR